MNLVLLLRLNLTSLSLLHPRIPKTLETLHPLSHIRLIPDALVVLLANGVKVNHPYQQAIGKLGAVGGLQSLLVKLPLLL